jgi:hypothetical protein
MRKESEQTPEGSKQFRLGHLGSLNQVTLALGKTIRAMADGSLDSQQGARICNALGIMRSCLETATLQRMEERLNQFETARTTLEGVSYVDTTNDHSSLQAH